MNNGQRDRRGEVRHKTASANRRLRTKHCRAAEDPFIEVPFALRVGGSRWSEYWPMSEAYKGIASSASVVRLIIFLRDF